MTVLLWGLSVITYAALPDLVCQTETGISVNNKDLTLLDASQDDLYRIEDSRLHISSPSREEYSYGKLLEIEPGRYLAAHKSIVFDGNRYESALAVHIGTVQTRISKLHCVETHNEVK
jgi:hypothetical protein